MENLDDAAIAIAHGRAPSWPRRLVDLGYVTASQSNRASNGRIIWQCDRAERRRQLRANGFLESLNYRGNNRKFLLWYFGLLPYSDAIPKAVVNILAELRTLCRKYVDSHALALPSAYIAIKISSLGEWNKSALRKIVENKLLKEILKGSLDITGLTNIVDIGLVFRLAVAFNLSVLGIAPLTLGYNVLYDKKSILNSLSQCAQLSDSIQRRLDSFLRSLQAGTLFEDAVGLLQKSRESDWNVAREYVRKNKTFKSLTRIVIPTLARERQRVGKTRKGFLVSNRTLENHTILRYPTLILLTIFIAIAVILHVKSLDE